MKRFADTAARELWMIERHGALEHRVAMVEVRGSIEDALRAAKEALPDV